MSKRKLILIQTFEVILFLVFHVFIGFSQEQMEIAGAVTIQNSNTNTPSEGTIRWNPAVEDFEGYNGTEWLSLTDNSSSTPLLPVMSEEEQYATSPRESLTRSGYAVAIEGKYAFVGSPGDYGGKGAVHVFKYAGDQWYENQTLLASDGVAGDGFGTSMAVHGDKIIIGAYLKDEMGLSNPGKVYFYHFEGIEWVERQWQLAQIGQGKCLDIHENFAIVGSPHTSKISIAEIGSVDIYEYNGSQWNSIESFLDAPLQEDENFGSAVALNDKWAIVGAASYDGPSTTNQGKVIIYRNTGNIWQLETEIDGPLAQPAENFGYDIDISGDTIAISAIGTTVNGKVLAGSVYIFAWNGSIWQQIDNLTLGAPGAFDLFGQSVALKGNQLLVGAHYREVNSVIDQGIVLNYININGTWKLLGEYTDPDAEANGEYGWDVDMDGRHRITGMPKASLPSGSGSLHGKVVIGPLVESP